MLYHDYKILCRYKLPKREYFKMRWFGGAYNGPFIQEMFKDPIIRSYKGQFSGSDAVRPNWF